jgi:hypothetical protein
LRTLKAARVLRAPEPVRIEVEDLVPWWAQRVGRMAPVERFATRPENALPWELVLSRAWAAWFREVVRDDGPAPRIVRTARSSGTIDARDVPTGAVVLTVGRLPVRLRCPPWLGYLELSGALDRLKVEVPQASCPLKVKIRAAELPPRAIAGLEHLERLEVEGLHHLDVERLARYPRLAELSLTGAFDARPTLAHPEAFAQLRDLSDLTLTQFEAFDASRFPAARALPKLVYATLDRLAADDVRQLRKKLAGIRELIVFGIKRVPATRKRRLPDGDRTALPDALAVWSDEDPGLGRAASSAWRRASRLLAAKPAASGSERAIKGFVRAMNRAAEHHDLDTIAREQLGDAVGELATRFGIAARDAQRWFDDVREF